MAAVWRVLTAAMVVTHFTVGCCVHHTHACDASARLFSPLADRSPDHAGPGDHLKPCSGDHDGCADHSHQEPHGCKGTTCSAVRHEPSLDFPCGNPAPAVIELPAAGDVDLSATAREDNLLSTGRLLLPVRLHLANQVLLI